MAALPVAEKPAVSFCGSSWLCLKNISSKLSNILLITAGTSASLRQFISLSLTSFCVHTCKGERRNMQPGCDVCPCVCLSVCNKPRPLRHKLLLALAKQTQSFLVTRPAFSLFCFPLLPAVFGIVFPVVKLIYLMPHLSTVGIFCVL